MLRKTLALAVVGPLGLAVAALVVLPPAPSAAQEVVQDEGTAYRAWYDASKAGDIAKASEAAKAYIATYPTGQYAEFLKKWLATADTLALDAAIKEKRTADAISLGRQVLAKQPGNVAVLVQLAFMIRNNELLASPPVFDHAPDAVDFAKQAVGRLEAGEAPASPGFDRNATLAGLYQILAVNEARSGNAQEALKLYERSTSLAPDNPQVAGRNLYAAYIIRQNAYGESVKAFKAASGATPPAEPTAEMKAALDRVNQDADTLIDGGAAFVAFAKAKNFAPGMRDKVSQTVEAVYKSRHPEDAALAGLQKLLQEKEAALAVPPPPAAPAAPPAAPPGD